MIPSTHLTRADIEEIKSSVLYSICNTDQNMTFYDWYNEAKIMKAKSRSELVVDIYDE